MIKMKAGVPHSDDPNARDDSLNTGLNAGDEIRAKQLDFNFSPFKVHHKDGVIILEVPSLGKRESGDEIWDRFNEAMVALANVGEPIVLDLRSANRFLSSALTGVINANKILKERGDSLVVCTSDANYIDIFEITHLNRQVKLFTSMEEAIDRAVQPLTEVID